MFYLSLGSTRILPTNPPFRSLASLGNPTRNQIGSVVKHNVPGAPLRSLIVSLLLDYFWPLSFALAGAAAVGGWAFLRTGRRLMLATSFACALSLAGLIVLDQWIETPIEQARASLDRIVNAARTGDADTIAGLIAPTYSDESRDRAGLESVVRQHFSRARLSTISIAGLQLSRESSERVAARFVAHISGAYQGQSTGAESYPVRLRIDFVADEGVWKMGCVRRFDPIQSAREIPLDRVP